MKRLLLASMLAVSVTAQTKYCSFATTAGASKSTTLSAACALTQSQWTGLTAATYTTGTTGLWVRSSVGWTPSPCANGSIGLTAYGMTWHFNTSGISGTIASAVLWFRTGGKSLTATPATTRGLYIKKASGGPIPVGEVPTDLNSDPTTNRVASITMASITANAWNSVSLSSPDTTVNKSGSTYLYAFIADAIAQTFTDTSVYGEYAVYLYGSNTGSEAERPYLVITLAGGARLIVVSDSD